MKWTDKQLEIMLYTINEADGGCCICVRSCIYTFIEKNDFDYSLLERLKSLYKKEMNEIYKWEELCPTLKEIKEYKEEIRHLGDI